MGYNGGVMRLDGIGGGQAADGRMEREAGRRAADLIWWGYSGSVLTRSSSAAIFSIRAPNGKVGPKNIGPMPR